MHIRDSTLRPHVKILDFPASLTCLSGRGRPAPNRSRKAEMRNETRSTVYRILCDTEYLYYCMDYAQTRIEKVAIELRGLTSKANNAANYLSSCAHACACPTLTVTLPPSIPSLHKRTLCTTQSEQPFMRFCEKVSSERLSRSRTTITRYAS